MIFFWGYCTPIFEKHPYIPKMFFFSSSFFFKKYFFFEVPATNESSKTDRGFSKGFLIVSDGVCSSPKKGENKSIFQYETIHTGKLTWNLNIRQMKRKIIFHPPSWLWDPALNFPWKIFKIWGSDILHSSFHKPCTNKANEGENSGGLYLVESMVLSDTKDRIPVSCLLFDAFSYMCLTLTFTFKG